MEIDLLSLEQEMVFEIQQNDHLEFLFVLRLEESLPFLFCRRAVESVLFLSCFEMKIPPVQEFERVFL